MQSFKKADVDSKFVTEVTCRQSRFLGHVLEKIKFENGFRLKMVA